MITRHQNAFPAREAEPSNLWSSEDLLKKAIFNSKQFLLIATEETGMIQFFNKGAEFVLGYTSLETTNQLSIVKIIDMENISECISNIEFDIHAADSQKFNLLVRNALRDTSGLYKFKSIRKDGSIFPAIGSVVILNNDLHEKIGYLFFGQDNTHQENSEKMHTEALEVSEQKAQRILETASDAFIAMNSNGEISEWNVQAQRLFGWSRHEVIGKSLSETIVSPPFREGHERGLQHFLETGEGPVLNRTIEVLGIRRDGTDIPLELSVWIVKTSEGYGFNSFMHDLTERKLTEDRKLRELTLIAKNTELEHSSRRKSEFLATMSHELRTPLNAIIGFSEALQDGLVGPISAIQKEYLGDILSSGEHLLSLINDILDLSKVEAGMMELDLESVDIKSLLSDSLSIVREKAITQRLTLELEIADDLGMPCLDVRKTKQIIYNLLSNAVKFTPVGGKIVIQVRRVFRNAVGQLPGQWPVHSLAMIYKNCEEFLEIIVFDTGIGILSENMLALFHPFNQVDGSLSRKFEGSGLGLAMVKNLTELHGGAVAVASQENEGSRFAIWLPLVNLLISD